MLSFLISIDAIYSVVQHAVQPFFLIILSLVCFDCDKHILKLQLADNVLKLDTRTPTNEEMDLWRYKMMFQWRWPTLFFEYVFPFAFSWSKAEKFKINLTFGGASNKIFFCIQSVSFTFSVWMWHIRNKFGCTPFE